MTRRPIVLVFVRYYLPGFRAGGPIRSIANMVSRLSTFLEFKIVALNHDLGSDSPYPGATDSEWTRVGAASVLYVQPNISWHQLRRIMRSTHHDAIYLNSFFDLRFTLLPMLINRFSGSSTRAVVIAPRGEFSSAALGLKRFRKFFYLRLVRWWSLFDNVTWQASSEHECHDIRRALDSRMAAGTHAQDFGTGHIVTVPVLADLAQVHACQKRNSHDGSIGLRVCFLSRISPMKNLSFALKILSRTGIPVFFSIYGPIEDYAYWVECLALIKKMPAHVHVTHLGAVAHNEVAQTISSHDLFFLPTLGENYGHVIHEALSAGVPVLISDRTPWRQLESNGAGWAISLDNEDNFISAIEEAGSWSMSERQKRGANAQMIAASVTDDPESVEANRRLFLDAIEVGRP